VWILIDTVWRINDVLSSGERPAAGCVTGRSR
jgi:hypothetical protein